MARLWQPSAEIRCVAPGATSLVNWAPMAAEVTPLSELARAIRRGVLEQSKRAEVGHVGSSLSVADLLAALYGGVLRIASSNDLDRDRFVLSKGHAGLALYVTLAETGRIPAAALDTFCTDGTLLGTHPEHRLSFVDFSTGSLGQGLSFGAGAALAGRLSGGGRRAFVLLSDAECNEGSVWEAAMFAAHHKLSNLVAIVDVNGQQALGYTRDVIDTSPLEERWRAFGWDTRNVDGHDPQAIQHTIADLAFEAGKPHVVVARTTFGRGVSFMENRIEWHYLPMTEEQYKTAMFEVSR